MRRNRVKKMMGSEQFNQCDVLQKKVQFQRKVLIYDQRLAPGHQLELIFYDDKKPPKKSVVFCLTDPELCNNYGNYGPLHVSQDLSRNKKPPISDYYNQNMYFVVKGIIKIYSKSK